MSTFISCAFREQEDDQAAHPILPSLLVSSQGRGLIDLPLRASNEDWFIWSILSISFVWLAGPETHPEEPERPANQTDEPVREHRRSSGSIPSALCEQEDGQAAHPR
jgi:hypothetical protein